MTATPISFTELLKAGKIDEARAMLKAEKIKAKFAPDTIIQKQGESAVFTKRGKRVELDEHGNWQLKK